MLNLSATLERRPKPTTKNLGQMAATQFLLIEENCNFTIKSKSVQLKKLHNFHCKKTLKLAVKDIA
jgi:hypothetical protein